MVNVEIAHFWWVISGVCKKDLGSALPLTWDVVTSCPGLPEQRGFLRCRAFSAKTRTAQAKVAWWIPCPVALPLEICLKVTSQERLLLILLIGGTCESANLDAI